MIKGKNKKKSHLDSQVILEIQCKYGIHDILDRQSIYYTPGCIWLCRHLLCPTNQNIHIAKSVYDNKDITNSLLTKPSNLPRICHCMITVGIIHKHLFCPVHEQQNTDT